ncbi:MAG TPA: tetratricopeptide repeat protein [Polyangiales bacterium]|nr:tetratricopeptide repeat protein [Polyangiales bacterium]
MFTLALVLHAAAAGVARADDPKMARSMSDADMSDERARAHFKAGTSLYDSGRFPEAAEEWEQAYALSKRNALLYNIYVAHRDASNLPKAIDALQRYLATNDPDPSARLNLEARLKAMQAAQAQADEQRKASEAAASTPPPSAAAQPAPAPAAPPPTSSGAHTEIYRSSSEQVLPVTLMILGSALTTGGIITGIVTRSRVAELEKHCPGNVCPPSYDLHSQKDTAQTTAIVTDVLLATGIVSGGLGVILWFTSGEEVEVQNAKLRPGLACAPGACQATLRGTF